MNQNVASYPSVLGIPDCIEERVSFDASLAPVVGSSARWSSYESRYQSGIVTGSAFLTRPLPRYVSRVRNDRIYTATLVQATPSAPLAGRATISYRYLISENSNWRTLFPNLDFLLCPCLQGITNEDLDKGKTIENIAGELPATLTTSRTYLYPNKRLLYIDNNGWFNYNVEGVEKYAPLWSRYYYNMFGVVDYPGNGHYCVAMIYEDEIYNYEGTNYSGVELQQNNQNWNASGMFHFKGATNIRRIGFNGTNIGSGNNQDGVCVLIFNVDVTENEYPRTYVYQKNISTNRVFVDNTYVRTAYVSPRQLTNVYVRSVLNDQGRVKWLSVMRGTQDEATIEVLKHYLISFASS